MNILWTQFGAVAGSILGLTGTVLGLINGWFLLRDRQQLVTIDWIKGDRPLDFRMTNRSRRPVPIDSVVLRFHEQMPDLIWRDVDYVPNIGDFKIPGTLLPETSVPLRWSTRETASFVAYRKVQIIIKTQTGKQIKRTFRRANKPIQPIANLRLAQADR